jgi:hypothetical protein
MPTVEDEPKLPICLRSIPHDKLCLQQSNISIRLRSKVVSSGGEKIDSEIGHFDIVLRKRR